MVDFFSMRKRIALNRSYAEGECGRRGCYGKETGGSGPRGCTLDSLLYPFLCWTSCSGTMDIVLWGMLQIWSPYNEPESTYKSL